MALVLAVMYSCKESEESAQPANSSQYYSETNGVSILNNTALGYIEAPIQSDSLIVFANNTPEEALPKVGSPIYIPESEKAPYGMLAKVVSIKKGSSISVITEPLSLEEAFDYLSVDTTFTVTKELEGVFDMDGNPIDFEIVDTADIDLNDTTVVSMARRATTRAHEDFKFDWDWKSQSLKFPVKLYKGSSGKDKIDITGAAYVGFRKFDFDIDISNHKLNYVNLDATPYIKIGLQSKVTTERRLELSDRLGQLRFKITIPTPVGIPIIIPITVYVYGTCGIVGELSATLGLQYEYNCNCVATFKNGQWSSKATHGGFNNKSPWTVGEFDVKGEIYSGAKIGLLAGLYSATTGIGFNVSPNFSLGVEAKLSSKDLLKTNPEVDLMLKVGGDVYCVAELFGKKLAKYSLQFPDYILWSEKTYLLPKIENFEAIGSSSSAEISWSHDAFYFLEPIGVKTGTAIFESDMTTEVKSYKPSPSSGSNFYTNVYNVDATGLTAGKTYYAAPFAYWRDYKWYGDMTEFSTEAGYKVMWRCEGREDIWSIDININSNTTAINLPFEAATYDGWTKRLMVATYNPSTGILTGTVETNFYNNPEDRRIDGFTADLKKDDTGYMTNSKVLDNGACYTQIRFVKMGSNGSRARIKKLPLGEDECGLGEHLTH